MKVLFHVPIHRFYAKANRSWFDIDKNDVELDYFITAYDPGPPDELYKNLLFKMKKAREFVLAAGYDWLFNVEHDVVLPKNALQKLLARNFGVVSGLYRLRPSNVIHRNFCARVLNPQGPQDSDDRYLEIGKDFKFGDIVKCSLLCFGCILIHRQILENIDFRIGGDVDFCRDIEQCKYPLYVDTGVKCGHIDRTGEEIKC